MASTKSAARKSGTKSAPKRAPKSSAKPKRGKRQTAATKSKPAGNGRQSIKTRAVKLTSKSGAKRTVRRPVESHQFGRGGTTRRPELASAADRASAMVCTDGAGQPIGRARVGTVQVGMVLDGFVGRKRPADVLHRLIGAKRQSDSAKLAREYADGKIGRTDLPDGTGERLSAAAKSIGDPTKHKLSGKAFVAVLVGLAENPPKRSK